MKLISETVRKLARRSLIPLALVAVIVATVGWWATEAIAEIEFRRAQEALRRFDYAAAREHLRDCLALRPDRFQFHFTAAQTERRAGNVPQALFHLDRCQKLAGDENDISSLERILLQAQDGGVIRVEAPLWRLVEQDHSDKSLILEALARGYLRVYSLPLADKALKMLVEEQPTHAEAWFLRGGICELLGASKEGLDYYRQAVTLRPDDDLYRLRLASCLMETHRSQEARPHLEKLCRKQPDNPDVLSELARALSYTERKDRCRELLAHALAVRPNHARALAETAKLDLGEGNLSAAEDSLRKAIQTDPSDQVNHYLLFRCLEKAGKKEAARQQQARWNTVVKELGRLEEIVRVQIPKNPRSADLYFELGMIFTHHGKLARARSSYAQALLCDPRHQASLQALARNAASPTPSRAPE